MVSEDIPSEVLRFISQYIDTVPQMEALLLLWESAPRLWSDEELAARLYVDLETGRRIIGDLHRRKFVASAEDGRWSYDAANENAELLPIVAMTYRRQLARVARFIHSKGTPAMLEFARAFQFKNER